MGKLVSILLFAILLSSCRTSQPSVERYTRDSTIIREVPVLVEVPGSVIQSPSINIDSLANLIRAGIKPEVINNTLVREDPETKLQVGLLIDELGNLSALCEQQDRVIEALSKEVEHWRIEYEKVTVVEKVPWWEKLYQGVQLLGLVALIVVIILLVDRFRR